MISKELSSVINGSFKSAKNQMSEFLTVEHLFMSLLHNESGSAILQSMDLDIERTIAELEVYLSNSIEKVEDNTDENYLPVETMSVNRVLNDMLLHVESSGKKVADVGDLLASIFNEEKSYSVFLLKKNNINRLDVLNYITENEHPEEKTAEEAGQKKDKKKAGYLENFAVNLTELAATGKIDPVIGREREMQQMIRTLCRRKKNNPMLIGEAGVGKTAIVEGFAREISIGNVPKMFINAQVFAVDLGGMVAGTKYRGEFEKRLKGVIDELKQQEDAILFIDEIHNTIGAGSASGSMDASNLLKPVLASGELRCIGATTYAEVKRFFDKEKALTRRFEKIDVSEPDTDLTYKILKGLKSRYEDFHQASYTDEALRKSIELSVRYINNKFLPDKAIDIIDEAGAALRLHRRVKKRVTVQDIENLVAEKLKIPAKTVSSDDKESLKNLDSSLKERIFGQDEAIEQLVSSIKRNKAGLGDPEKPIGAFLFTGPSGVGKTAVSKELADVLNVKFERIDMSEYMEKHTVSRLIGAPAGYVGYEEGGLLTEAVRKNPYCILLLDEIEKAHVDVLNILLQIMDSSTLTDTTGIKVDFKNVIIIMTSNIGSKDTRQIGFAKDESFTSDNAVKKFFSPEFRNRLDAIVNFSLLKQSVVKNIVGKFIADLSLQLKARKVKITITEDAVAYLAAKGYNTELGARPLARVIQQEIKSPLTDELLFGNLAGGGTVEIGCRGQGIVFRYGK